MTTTTTMENRTATMSASAITGSRVMNPAGESLGKLEDLMLDFDNGRVAYGVLSFGGFLGMGDKLFAIPFQALRHDADRNAFVLDVDKEKLEKAPGFDKDNWPSTEDRAWGSQMHSYYGYTPYWV